MNYALYRAVFWIFEVMKWAIFIRVIISWFPIPRDNQLIRILYQITEPILGPIRRMIENSPLGRNMMLDFSPIIAFLIIELIQSIIF